MTDRPVSEEREPNWAEYILYGDEDCGVTVAHKDCEIDAVGTMGFAHVGAWRPRHAEYVANISTVMELAKEHWRKYHQ